MRESKSLGQGSDTVHFLPISVVARRLGRHTTTIWRLIDDGKVEAVRLGRDWFLLEDSLPLVEASLKPKRSKKR